MLDLSTSKKHKINLSDYNYQQDLDSRALLSDFTLFDLEVLEEILFSPLKTSIKKISRVLDCSEGDLDAILEKLSRCSLLQKQNDVLIIDKERRKYFEFQMARFEEQFKPDMVFLQSLLKQVPIHVLPLWYAIPRTSNNIFESIVEKYLQTPQIYQRYLLEQQFADPIIQSIVSDLFSSKELKLSSSDLISKYNLKRADFDQIVLQLEYHFIAFVSYQREEDHWHEVITPFHEWREYLFFLNRTTTPVIRETEALVRHRESDFSFVEDLGAILSLAKKEPISLEYNKEGELSASSLLILSDQCHLSVHSQEELFFAQTYLSRLIEKLLMIKLADWIDNKLYALESANDWLDLDLQTRCVYLYRHPLNRLVHDSLPISLCSERAIREAEKSIKRVLHGEWVFFEDFIPGVIVPLNENSVVVLKKHGKQWKFTVPQYSEEEKLLIKATIFEWLFECGIVSIGSIGEKDCFAVTAFGQSFFAD